MTDRDDFKPDGNQDADGDDNRDADRKPGQRKQPPNMFGRGAWGWVVVAALAVALLLMFSQANLNARKINTDQFINYIKQKQFEGAVTVENSRMVGTLKETTPGLKERESRKVEAPISVSSKQEYVKLLIAEGHAYGEDAAESLLLAILITWGPLILICFLIYFFVFRSIRGGAGGAGMLGNFGRSRHRVMTKEHSNVTLDDVAGVDEAKEEVQEIIEFLKNPKKFQRLGGRVPRGVLLEGLPGCGKTLLAKAMAGEADVPFFSISGSDFVEMFVGVGASRVRDLFKQAKDSSPCIIFLDEVDAVGRRRGSGFASGGHDEREQTLNAILVEMDGFDTSDQVIIVAATNRSDVLDPALTRPGRFDRQIQVPLPDLRGRMEILKVHSRRIKISPDVDLEKLARGTPMFSGADLAAIINEAAILATLLGKDFVEQEDLEESRDKVRFGRALKSRRIDEDEKKVVAYHEAGHAAIMYCDDDAEPLHKVTIIPRGPSLGSSMMLPEKDRHIWSKRQLLAQLRVCFGGRIAEEMFCGDQYNGTAGDIRQATGIARAMITEYGMSEKLGFQLFNTDDPTNPWEAAQRNYSDDTARLIDAEVKLLIDRAYQETRDLINERREGVTRIAEALLQYETLSFDDVDHLMKGQPLSKPTVSELLRAEQKKQPPKKQHRSTGDDEQLDHPPDAMPSPA